MKKLPFAIVALPFLALLSGCPDHRPKKRDVLAPPAESGVVKSDLRGRWRITEVDVRHLVGDGEGMSAPPPERGLMPPAVGATITIAGREFVGGNGVPLRREDLNDATVVISSYINQVSDRFAIYTMRRHTNWSRVVKGVVPSGLATLQMALGTIDRDHLLGVIYHQAVGPALRPGDPIEVMAQVRLERLE